MTWDSGGRVGPGVLVRNYSLGSFGLLFTVLQVFLPGASPISAATRPAAQLKKSNLGKDVVRQLVRDLSQDCVDGDAPMTPEQHFAPEEIDLNGDGTPEAVVKGSGCLSSPTGNGWLGIYRRTKGGYEQLLDAGVVQTYRFLASRSHGYRDLVATMHGSAYDSAVFLLRFDGKRYKLRECYDRNYQILDSKGDELVLKKPQVTRISCEDYREEVENDPDPPKQSPG